VVKHALNDTGQVRVEVAYAVADWQSVIELQLPAGSTAGEAVKASGILERFPGIDLAQNAVGIFGRVVPLSRVLRTGDRVEIYRPLIADPKLMRRKRAERARKKPARQGGLIGES
jgi:hypothetical protein